MSRTLDHDLLEAVNANKFEAVRTLLQNPKVNVDKFNCIHWAVTFEKVEMTKILIDAGANLNQLGMAGKESPLLIAASRQNLTIVEMLLNAGADASLGSAHGVTPIMVAYKKEVAALLLKFGAKVNCCDHKGATPLMRALAHHRIDVAHLLIAAGADVNVRDKDGYTPLIAAVEKGYEAGVKVLLQGGADTSIPAGSGRSVFEIAQHAGIIKLLQAYRQGSSYTKDDNNKPTVAAPPEQKAVVTAASAVVTPPVDAASSSKAVSKVSSRDSPPLTSSADDDDVPGVVHVRGRTLFSRIFGSHSSHRHGSSSHVDRRASTGGIGQSSNSGASDRAPIEQTGTNSPTRVTGVVAPASVVTSASFSTDRYDGTPVAVAMAVGVEATEHTGQRDGQGEEKGGTTAAGLSESAVIVRLESRVAALERQVQEQSVLLQQQARDIAELRAL